MFRCQICGQVAAPGTRATKVAVVSRAKVYRSRGGSPEGAFRGRGRFRAPKPPTDAGGKGHEIVQELTACVACAAKQETTIIEAEPEPEVLAEGETPTEETAATEEAVATDAPAATEEAPAAEEAAAEAPAAEAEEKAAE